MGGDILRKTAAVAMAIPTGGTSLLWLKDKKKKAAVLDPTIAAREKALTDPYNMASKTDKARLSLLASTQETSTNGKATLLGG